MFRLCYKLQTEPWSKSNNIYALTPYAFKGNDWATYDDVISIAAKIKYANGLGIKKIMTWSIETDDFHGLCGDGTNPLLKVINKYLGNESTGTTEGTTSSSSGTSSDSSATTISASSSSSSTIITTESSVNGFSCQQEGFASNPLDCSSFYRCIKDAAGGLVPKKFQCPAELYWQQEAVSCNYKEFVQCG